MKQPSGSGTVVNKCQNINPSANKASSVSCGFTIILTNPYIGIKYVHFFIAYNLSIIFSVFKYKKKTWNIQAFFKKFNPYLKIFYLSYTTEIILSKSLPLPKKSYPSFRISFTLLNFSTASVLEFSCSFISFSNDCSFLE